MILAITKKELRAYFGSPMAAIFIGVFLFAALFTFFWIETFFARNTADIRPLFRWLPVLLLFLVSALTMRQWSEEQRMGTLETLFTLPVSTTRLVAGKFLAVLLLVALALALTLGLPVTVSLIGPLDWGPVIGGYLGALLMAAAYIAIGLFISSRTDNQIIALILSVLVSGLFYLVGSSGVTDFFGTSAANLLRAMGTGSRFASIERGVIDLRDVVYYLSLTGVFLAANVLSLESKRWSEGRNTARLRRNAIVAMILIAANLACLNLWLDRFGKVRLDLTEDREYSISEPTRNLLSTLTEPLVLRGYFSEKTHPLLAPLVPRIKDMMREYAIAGKPMVKVSFVDPRYDQEAEIEANEQYGIKPVPFQVAGRYEASVVNSYFNILVKYGDQYTTLGFEDLIEVERRKDGQLDVRLRNLEYDLTRSVKKVVYGFQSLASVLARSGEPLRLLLLVTPDKLPESLADTPATIREVARELQKEAGGRLAFEEIDPLAKGMSAKEIETRYGVRPLAAGFFSPDTFYLHLLVAKGNTYDRVYLGDMSKATIRKEAEGVLKRNASGFLKTIGYWTPEPAPANPYMGRSREEYTIFQQALRQDYNLERVDLSSGHVPGDIDVLLLVAPQGLGDMEKLAVDQYLMRGGAVVVLAGSYVLDLAPYSQVLAIKEVRDGIDDLLAHYGIEVGRELVMDLQNEPFPIPVERDLGGLRVREIRQMSYPFFVDVRPDGMDRQNPIVANLPAVTLNWVSPLTIDEEKNKERTVSVLARSTPQSWLRASTDIQPDFRRYPDLGFAVGGHQQSYPLAVAVQGAFHSFFDGKPDPRIEQKKKEEAEKEAGKEGGKDEGEETQEKDEPAPEPLITESPDSARLVVIGSSEFVNDTVIGISRSLGQDRFLNGLEFLHNAVDWAVEDQELLAIRSRGSHARLLAPLSRKEQRFWEGVNYGIALAALVLVAAAGWFVGRREKPLAIA